MGRDSRIEIWYGRPGVIESWRHGFFDSFTSLLNYCDDLQQKYCNSKRKASNLIVKGLNTRQLLNIIETLHSVWVESVKRCPDTMTRYLNLRYDERLAENIYAVRIDGLKDVVRYA